MVRPLWGRWVGRLRNRMARGCGWRQALAIVVAALWLCGGFVTRALAQDAAANALVEEVRRSFTFGGQAIPPEIFRDFGDGDLADSGSIWVTVDLAAAVGSNLYFDPIRGVGDWQVQKNERRGPSVEETAYRFSGTTENGLLVVLASYNGGGSGTFYTLHLLDVAAGVGFDNEGKRTPRINLTNVRSIILGDRWEGDVSIAGNAVTVTTTRNGPADESARPPQTIEAQRP